MKNAEDRSMIDSLRILDYEDLLLYAYAASFTASMLADAQPGQQKEMPQPPFLTDNERNRLEEVSYRVFHKQVALQNAAGNN